LPAVTFSNGLRTDYEQLFHACSVRAERARDVDRLIDRMVANRARYERVTNRTGVPWCFVAVIHNMESSQNFGCHLHNGDPLTARTVQVPAGRPRQGQPPFTWEDSAADALALKRLGADTDWSLAGILYQLESYNGWGYRRFHPDVPTPYLWSFSNHYISGKYVADGRWSDTAVSKQCGAAVLLRRMAERGLDSFADQPAPRRNEGPLIVRHSNRKPRDPAEVAKAEALQRWLNTFPGIFVKADGVPGDRTSEAYRTVTGHFLPGDPREQ
jgi:lysozyme family protein